MTRSALATRSSREICLPIRAMRRPRHIPRWATSRSTAISIGVSTTMTAAKTRPLVTVSVSSGVSSTTTRSVPASASMRRRISARTAGCTIALRAATDSSSLNAIAASPARSSEPSARMMCGAEAGRQLVEQRRARHLQLADDAVGVDDHRAALGEA